MSAVPHRQMVADFRAARAEIATATGAEKAELVGFCRGIRQAAITQGYSFDAQVRSADLNEEEPQFKIDSQCNLNVEEARALIAQVREAASGDGEDAEELREILAEGKTGWIIDDARGVGIRFNRGGLMAYSDWRPPALPAGAG